MVNTNAIKQRVNNEALAERLSLLAQKNGKTNGSEIRKYMVNLDKESLGYLQGIFNAELNASFSELAELLRTGLRPKVQVNHTSSGGLTKADFENSTSKSVTGGYGSLTAGTKTVTTAGTAVQVATSSTPCKCVIVNADLGNSGAVVVGNSAVSATSGSMKGIILIPGNNPVTLNIDDLNKLWVDAVNSGDELSYTYFS